ncbi:M15 family metallopeptidase [Propionicimonas sp.]|uniref:M15 family metallopeptidase n=1 Tax=Propionicimonas sp. TaxID=1955623 RepID=UPI0017F28F07|nr:M15 family metallopeptidase [Propionicimonas sp.]MBU3975634.1 M15 family metallopeptidase [Actinomycetota bacterium]MBA3019963.1 M15 family metallopeptidase [Propionicimonas sp.]MBU3986217.1 M15 family metallopeptidase [Actinomycetota bacterium]MBU4007786.1 M15 family metallopeptidase [Actinomycetota bacterium]MBU4064044.1 M15 family metallopeptidase [Actinomycetota bacterium]
MRSVSLTVLTATVCLTLGGCAITPPPGLAPTAGSTAAVPIQPSSSAPSLSSTPTPSSTAPTPDRRKGRQLNQPYAVNGLIVVSKKHRISASYGPDNPTGANQLDSATAKALAKMTAAAKADGVVVVVKSGYRSWTTQKATYDRALRTQPQNISYYAPPGASEHQTGLAVDLWDGRVWYRPMENTATGKWLHKHAHEYGFILRFPKGKQKITGVAYEPWHFRYVGLEHSIKFDKANSLTLEEYLGLD